jgi:hypothetical protein
MLHHERDHVADEAIAGFGGEVVFTGPAAPKPVFKDPIVWLTVADERWIVSQIAGDSRYPHVAQAIRDAKTNYRNGGSLVIQVGIDWSAYAPHPYDLPPSAVASLWQRDFREWHYRYIYCAPGRMPRRMPSDGWPRLSEPRRCDSVGHERLIREMNARRAFSLATEEHRGGRNWAMLRSRFLRDLDQGETVSVDVGEQRTMTG